jgi:hypothetical protein
LTLLWWEGYFLGRGTLHYILPCFHIPHSIETLTMPARTRSHYLLAFYSASKTDNQKTPHMPLPATWCLLSTAERGGEPKSWDGPPTRACPLPVGSAALPNACWASVCPHSRVCIRGAGAVGPNTIPVCQPLAAVRIHERPCCVFIQDGSISCSTAGLSYVQNVFGFLTLDR